MSSRYSCGICVWVIVAFESISWRNEVEFLLFFKVEFDAKAPTAGAVDKSLKKNKI